MKQNWFNYSIPTHVSNLTVILPFFIEKNIAKKKKVQGIKCKKNFYDKQ